MIFRPLFAAAACAALIGCANDPAPITQLRLTEQAVEQAKAVGATRTLAQMALAESKLNQANLDNAQGAFKAARTNAEQAELDARLAEAKVLSEKSAEQITQLTTRVNRLRKQVGSAE